MAVTDPKVLDALPQDRTVHVTTRRADRKRVRVFHFWDTCGLISQAVGPLTIAEARQRDLGLCGMCSRRAISVAQREAVHA